MRDAKTIHIETKWIEKYIKDIETTLYYLVTLYGNRLATIRQSIDKSTFFVYLVLEDDISKTTFQLCSAKTLKRAKMKAEKYVSHIKLPKKMYDYLLLKRTKG